jgi:hypothetical protein
MSRIVEGNRILIVFLRGRVAILYIVKAVESRLCIERICRVKFHAAEAMVKSPTSQTFYSLFSNSLRKTDSLISTVLLEQVQSFMVSIGVYTIVQSCAFSVHDHVNFGCIVLRSVALFFVPMLSWE